MQPRQSSTDPSTESTAGRPQRGAVAGTATRRWPVRAGLAMDGYSARKRPSIGELDPLCVRALALGDGERTALVATIDVIGVDLELTNEIRGRLHDELGLEPDLVMIVATHTHSGPAGVRVGAQGRDHALRESLVEVVVATAHQAMSHRVGVTVAAGHASVAGLSQNRRDPALRAPTRLDVVTLHDHARRPVAVLTGFACHPTVLDDSNLELSADYPGAVIATAEAALGRATVMFLTGACADVNPARSEPSFDEVTRFGRVLGGAIVRLTGELGAVERPLLVDNLRWSERTSVAAPAGSRLDLSLRGRRREIRLPLKRFRSEGAYAEEIAAAESAVAAAGHDRGLRREAASRLSMLRAERASRPIAEAYRIRHGDTVLTELQFLALADRAGVLAFPGETFSTYETFARDAWEGDLMIAAYANDYVGYLNPAAAQDEGGYEAGRTLFGAAQQDRLEEGIRELLKLGPGSHPEPMGRRAS